MIMLFFYTETKGYWRLLNEAIPYDGKNEISFGPECKLEFNCEYSKIAETIKIINGYFSMNN